jgi:ferric-dicitrate binding protein FerR (iron transport regulator)
MHVLRGVFALSLCVFFCVYNVRLCAGGKALGILTLAYGAHLNASDAFAGLSIFDGERISTDPNGKIGVRIGGSMITLMEQSAATLQRSGDGAHVDLDAGSMYVWSAESNPLEVHVEGALLRPHGGHQVQAQVLTFAPKIVQITTRQGSVDFSYGKEFRVLPEGQTYRIYLESEDDPRSAPEPGADTRKPGMSTGAKVAYFILAGAGTGLAAWGIHDLIQSNNGVESPAKP